MIIAPASVPFQTFDMSALAGRRPPAPPALRDGTPGQAAALPDPALARWLTGLPAVQQAVFVGPWGPAAAAAYRTTHPQAGAVGLDWETASLSSAVVSAQLVVLIDTIDLPADRVTELAAAATHASTVVLVTRNESAAVDGRCAALMNAGWMPGLVSNVKPAAQDWSLVLEATRRFEPAIEAAAQAALFSAVVPTTEARQADAVPSPGLVEVNAQTVTVTGASSPAEVLDAVAPTITTPWVLLCRDAAYFPIGFGHRLNALLATIPEADRAGTLIGFIGIGVDAARQGFAPAGFVVEGARREDHPETVAAVSIDELAVVVARDSLHRIDSALGWHLWATDLCLTAICEHKIFPRIVAMPVLHRASQGKATPPEFHRAAQRLVQKHQAFGPIPTLNGTLDDAFVARHAEAILPVPASGHGPACSVCNQSVQAWTPHPQRGLRSEFMKLLDVVGSDLSVYLCPHCHSTDRDRHLWHYMRAAGLLDQLPNCRVLHIAPERSLEALIQAQAPLAYVRGDLHPTRAGHLKLDVEVLSFDDGAFDLIICNHVLEHVGDPARALAEFHRCLQPGGLLIAQTPYAPDLKHTLELNRPVSSAFAKLFYGQEDHVRLFGADIVDLFHAAGFSGELLSHAAVLGDMDAKAHGCNGREPFFGFTR